MKPFRSLLGAGSLDDNEFLDAARSIIETPPSPVRTRMMFVICAMALVAIVGGWFCRVDIYATAQGRIQPKGRSKLLQPSQPGKVMRILVQNGDSVRAGQLLIELDPIDARAAWQKLADQHSELEGDAIRLRETIAAARSGDPGQRRVLRFPDDVSAATREREQSVLDADLGDLAASLVLLRGKLAQQVAHHAALAGTVAAQQALVSTSSQRVAMHTRLAEKGYDSQVNLVDAQEDLRTQTATLVTTRGDLAEAVEQIKVMQAEIDATLTHFILSNSQTLETTEKNLAQVSQDLVQATDQLARTRLVSPIDGTVQELSVTTVGQVVQAGQQLMTIVPHGSTLEIEALVLNRDIGFVQPDQPAVIEVDSFPFTRYGTVSGRVRHIYKEAVTSSEAFTDESTQNKPVSPGTSDAGPLPKLGELVYPVAVSLDHPDIEIDGVPHPLTPGMTAVVEIRTGSRRLLEYLLSPVVEAVANSGHER